MDYKGNTNWLISTENIRPGANAIIGNNRLAFFAIHYVALCTIIISTACSFVVIFKILSKSKRSKVELDFPVRFPLYLALAEICWGLAHFLDHGYLVYVRKFPESQLMINVLSLNLWLFFGYQQLMHTSVSIYTYLRLIHRIRLDLGFWEWKLHLLSWSFLIFSGSILIYLDGVGPAGYWMGPSISNTSGMVFQGLACMTATLNAGCTTFGFYKIRKKFQKIVIPESGKNCEKLGSTTIKCLSTYVGVAACLYCPIAFLFWISTITLLVTREIEPLTALLLVIVSNSSGWANCYGYFRNEEIRRKRFKQKGLENDKQLPVQVSCTETERDTELTNTGTN